MFTKKKYNKLFELMNNKNLDAIMIAPSSDMEYLIGYNAHIDERLNCMVILKDKRYFHISPMLNYEEASKKYEEGSKFYIWSDGDGFLDTVVKSFKEYDLTNKRVGVNQSIRAIDVLDFKELLDTSFINAHSMLEEYRIIKSKEEINNLKEAGKIADKVMVDIKKYIKPGLLESDVINEIKRLYDVHGADSISFDPIVATGKSSSMPHYNAGTRTIQKGDSIVIDCGCRVNNACSDTSRTFFLGEPSEHQKKIYEICKKATFEAQEAAREGITAGELDNISRTIINDAGYEENFLNRTGHGIGFSVHEAPYIKANNNLILEEGMAFSLEPGIYIPNEFGMRVENIIVIENKKGVSVNNSPTDIEDVTIKV